MKELIINKERNYFFIISFLVGVSSGLIFFTFTINNEAFMMNLFENKLGNQTREFSGLQGWWNIFKANILFNASIIISGFIPFLFMPLIIGGIAFIAAGIAFGYVYLIDLSLYEAFFIGFLPHASLEGIAILTSMTVAMSISKKITLMLFNKKSKKTLKQIVFPSVTVITTLIIVSSLIEFFLTRYYYI